MIKSSLLVMLTCFSTLAIAQTESKSMSANETVVREFIAAWSDLDPGALADYFTEDGTYHNIPSNPVSGRANVERFISGFIQPWEQTDWEILNLVVDGDTVVVERMDRTVVAGSPVNLPCLGIFEMEAGKIKMWRDYFDLATYTDALGKALNQ